MKNAADFQGNEVFLKACPRQHAMTCETDAIEQPVQTGCIRFICQRKVGSGVSFQNIKQGE